MAFIVYEQAVARATFSRMRCDDVNAGLIYAESVKPVEWAEGPPKQLKDHCFHEPITVSSLGTLTIAYTAPYYTQTIVVRAI